MKRRRMKMEWMRFEQQSNASASGGKPLGAAWGRGGAGKKRRHNEPVLWRDPLVIIPKQARVKIG